MDVFEKELKRAKYLYIKSIDKTPAEQIVFENENEKTDYIKKFNEMRGAEKKNPNLIWDIPYE